MSKLLTFRVDRIGPCKRRLYIKEKGGRSLPQVVVLKMAKYYNPQDFVVLFILLHYKCVFLFGCFIFYIWEIADNHLEGLLRPLFLNRSNFPPLK